MSPAPDDLSPGPDETLDTLLRERIRLLQARKGYRTSVDAMALAWFACTSRPDARQVVDLGAGSGLVAILVARALPHARVTLVERQPQLASRAARNLRLNGVADRAEIVLHDLAEPLHLARGADLVVCNPPFFAAQGRQPAQHAERQTAHVESTAPLARFCQVAAQLLAQEGLACFVYPADGRARLVHALQDAGLGATTVHPLYHRDGDAQPVRLLVAASALPGTVQDGAPLHLHPAQARDDAYQAAIESFLAAL